MFISSDNQEELTEHNLNNTDSLQNTNSLSSRSLSNSPKFMPPRAKRNISEDAESPQTAHKADEPTKGKRMKRDSESTDSKNGTLVSGRSRPKSRTGCLNCKIRRKKCDETRPVCKDCERFGKECVWIDHDTMTIEDVRKLKERVQEQEKVSKIRVRTKNPRTGKNGVSKADPTRPTSSATSSAESRTQTPKDGTAQQHNKAPTSYLTEVKIEENFPLSIFQTMDNSNSVHEMMHTPLAPSTASPNYLSSLSAETPGGQLTNATPIQDRDEAEATIVREPSSTFLNFLREASLFASTSLDKLTLLDNEEEDQSASLTEQCSPKSSLQEVRQITGFNIYDFLEQVHPLSHDFPTQYLLLASSFNATFTTAPQPALSEVPELDARGLFLYNYYLETLSRKVSIAPLSQNESNSYQKVFLPLAQKDRGVLYAILAWAGFHLGGKYMKEGAKYAEKAVNYLLKDVDFTNSARIEDRRTIVFKLATILILCGAEICRGDVKIWSVYLDWGWRLLRDNGGILNFDTNKEEHWLISNFAYHDLLAVSERPAYFAADTYEKIFSDPNGNSKGNLNPLLGVSKGLFQVIGAINQYAYESRTPMRNYYGRKSPTSPATFVLSPTDTVSSEGSEQSYVSAHTAALNCLHASLDKAKELDQYIENCRPEMSDLVNLSEQDLELQLTTFEAFQISCKLHLRQSILKLNPSALECQILVHHLTKCVDILIGTPMQATLVFPIFIAGLCMVTEDDKMAMKKRFDLMMKLYGPWNVVRAKYIVEKVWELNPDGNKWIDWSIIVSDLGWELNFA